jgi:hypothetical protein
MTNNKNLTAVEWLLNEWPILKSELPHWLIEQAKEMEKQQIIKAIDSNFIYHENKISTIGEQYYNETYGGNK